MMAKKDFQLLTVLFLLFICPFFPAYGDDALSKKLDEEFKWLRAESYVFTATKTVEKTEKTGSSVTVITEDMIRKMGARNLADILQAVPGIGITVNNMGMTQIESRGIKTICSEKILVMIDGHPINLQLTNGGSVQWAFERLPADNMMRVEVVRGPGSALYGANAFLAVVNVITKDAGITDGAVLTAGTGTYDSYEYDLLFGKRFRNFSAAVNINYSDTEGLDRIVEKDAVGASGRTLLPTKKYDIDTKLGYNDLTFHGHYAYRKSDGPFIGAANALNDDSRQDYREWFLELKYNYKISDRFGIEPSVYYDNSRFDNFWEVFSEGFPGFGQGAFPDGMCARSAASSSKLGTNIILHSEFADTNKAVFGISVERQKQYEVKGIQNYDALTYSPLSGGMRDVTDDPNQIWAPEKDREFYAVFAEDIWDIRNDLRVVFGSRFDYYSDYGGAINPRASLIWEFAKGWNSRLLYGSAFRDPTFGELYNKNNLAVLGNPDLKPEKIKTYEIGVSGKFTDKIGVGITGFRNDITDLIVTGTPNTNSSTVRSTGFELEARYSFQPDSYVAVNYTFQDSEDKDTGNRVPDTPMHRGNIMVNFGLPKNWNLYTHVLLRSSTPRAVGDSRDDPPGYMTVNTALTSESFFGVKGLGFAMAVFNLLDKDYKDPSPSGTVYSDYPTPGRSLFARLSCKF